MKYPFEILGHDWRWGWMASNVGNDFVEQFEFITGPLSYLLKVKTGMPGAGRFGPEKPTPSASQPDFLVSRRGVETGAVFLGFTGFMEALFSV